MTTSSVCYWKWSHLILHTVKGLNWRISFLFSLCPRPPHDSPDTHPSPFIFLSLSTLIWKKGNKTLLVSPESLCIASIRTYMNHNTPHPPPPLCTSGASCAWDTRPFMSRKEMFTEGWEWESVCFHSKHLNMHHSLLTLNHEVGLEMNLALRSRARAPTHARIVRAFPRTRTASFLHFRLCGSTCKTPERSGTAATRDSQAGRSRAPTPPSPSFVFTSTTVFRKWKARIRAWRRSRTASTPPK